MVSFDYIIRDIGDIPFKCDQLYVYALEEGSDDVCFGKYFELEGNTRKQDSWGAVPIPDNDRGHITRKYKPL